MCNCMKNRVAAPAPAAAPRSAPINIQQIRARAISEPPPNPVDTSVWGANLWRVLHIAAHLSKSRNSIPLWRKVLEALRTGLPCPDCSAHYNAWYRAHPLKYSLIPIGGKGPIIHWILNLHNAVNERTGKAKWTIEQAKEEHGAPGLIEAAKHILANSLNGVIGSSAYSALDALLRAL